MQRKLHGLVTFKQAEREKVIFLSFRLALLVQQVSAFSGALPATALGEVGCDPTSLKWDGSYYSGLHKVCNVNKNPKLLPTERNRVGDYFY